MKKTISWTALMAVLCWSVASFAGTFRSRDLVGWMPAADVDALREESREWPLDVELLVEVAPGIEALEDDAHAAVFGHHAMVIAVDPTHHRSVVRFGNATGVKPADFAAVSSAGNAHFRAGEPRGGIEAIVARARASAAAPVPITEATSPPVIVEHGMSTGTWVGLALLFGLVAGTCCWIYVRSRRSQRAFQAALDENRMETGELRSRNVEEAAWADGVRSQPGMVGSRLGGGYSTQAPVQVPVVVNNVSGGGGGSDFLTGMLVGESLNPSHEVVIERSPTPPPVVSVDAGGSSSSYDSGSTSFDSPASSYDSGGSSSSFDSGGSTSFDSGGGGGFDSGGGGGDW